MNKFFESSEIEELTPEEAQKKLEQEGSITDHVKLEDPTSVPSYLQYDEKEDPEMEGSFNESLKKGYTLGTNKIKLEEGTINGFKLNDAIKKFIRSKRAQVSMEDFDDFYETCKDGFTDYGSNGNKNFCKRAFHNAIEELGLLDDEVEVAPKKAFDLKKTSKFTQNLVEKYKDFQDAASTAEESAEAKYDAIYDGVANILEGRSLKKHAFICGDAGVGKTFSVKQCKKELWDESPLKEQGWKYTYDKGNIGKSIAPITAYFFEHRDREVIVLDDADAFLAEGSDDVMNLLKGILNTENTIQNPEPVAITPTVRKIAAKFLLNKEDALIPTQQEVDCGLVGNFKESVGDKYFEIDKEKFNEGIWKIRVNGEVLYEKEMTPSEIGKYKLVEEQEYERHLEEKKKNSIYGLTLREGDLVDSYNAGDEIIGGGAEGDMLPDHFCFTSRLIMISNLAPSQVNDAFRSRCDVIPIVLTHEEFIAHCKVVVPGLLQDMETTLPQEFINKVRDLVYAYVLTAIEMEGQQLFGRTVEINLPLQFRIFADLAGKWLSQAGAYARRNNMKLNMKTFELIEKAIEAKYITGFVLPTLADNVYSGDRSKRR